MIKLIILAYLIGYSPINTGKQFKIAQPFDTMEECVEELTKNTTQFDGVYDIIITFVKYTDFDYDWVKAGCYHNDGSVEFVVYPKYDHGVPDGIQELLDKYN